MFPEIIQGGMGVGVSGWRLARAVSLHGQFGVVSGTALDTVLARRLQDGDRGGHMRRALDAFPFADISKEILRRYYRPEGRAPGEPYELVPLYRPTATSFKQQLTAAANFVEVWLAKEGHSGAVGINYLAKVQMPTLPSLYGAMLAGVDAVLMGAGIPQEIPGALDRLADGLAVSIRLDVKGPAIDEPDVLEFDPSAHGMAVRTRLKRPAFLPIVASSSLVTMLVRRANGSIEGFIIEGPTAGGHNAPPRGKKQLNERGEPVYGERDVVNLDEVAAVGLPFWVAGDMGRPGGLAEAKAAGAAGIQVGTLFAYCEESGLEPELRNAIIDRSRSGTIDVRTEDRASPTGFPFKSVDVPGSVSSDDAYAERARICDLGYLRSAYRRDDGKLVLRCPAEPVDTFVHAGGDAEETEGRRCLCNALLANIGLGQARDHDRVEPPLLTSGDDLAMLGSFLGDRAAYRAGDVIDYLLA